ncbi:MAG: 3-oxoacyl-[acyl-carrier-protein] synthase [Firmicutes bacterium]|nr:3-oxoacyl-[acyl-carrier-protein] synthase [Bacillota bacterium]
MHNAKIIGTGHYVPENIVTNDDMAKIIETSDEWISTRTGIKERRISTGENTSDMAAKAALKAIEDAKISVEDIDFIFLATYSPDAFIPNTACIVQSLIGAVNATCFDLSAACTGFIYGLDMATQYIKTGRAKCVLVIGAETQSKLLNWDDRGTCVLFGDGAGAAIMTTGEEAGVLACYSGSDGTKSWTLTVEGVPVRNPFVEGNPGSMYDLQNSTIKMDGKEIFKFAVGIMIKSVDELLKISGLNIEDIKYVVPHQANYRIIESTAKRLGLDIGKFFINIDRYGNTSAASVAIALDELAKSGNLEKGDKVLMVGFGGGLTYGGVIVEW